ncbi:hypothetical protein L6452_42675 [Arctium lappa]|uniref:Uncharacterized protein n=1 Tax=Arctium lappa TaxID=4217 RepID=A0ACB8XIW5_ARCLA|nr:hypothetical protein L6452_42675 [Arctium lappa]
MIDRRLLQNGQEHALELIFTEDGSARINAQMYMSMDENSEEPEWFPSTVYQFVILFASQGRYLSRNLHQVIKNIISRNMDSVAAANIDPNSSQMLRFARFVEC